VTLGAARAILFVPGDRPRRFARALHTGADAIVLDLEDAVAPDRKGLAREVVLAAVAELRTPRVGVRINPLSTPCGLRDLAALLDAPARPSFLVLAKVDSAAEVRLAVDALRWRGEVLCSVESSGALEHAGEIAGACEQVTAVGFGAVDLAAQLGARLEWAPLAAARARLVWGAASANVAALDGPTLDLAATGTLTADCERAAAMGFTGKIAIHPSQVDPILAAFTPTAEAVAQARAMLEAAGDRGAAAHAGAMVDAATVRQAQRTIARAAPAP
jgi:(S)-citramalyl-CoA lyase